MTEAQAKQLVSLLRKYKQNLTQPNKTDDFTAGFNSAWNMVFFLIYALAKEMRDNG